MIRKKIKLDLNKETIAKLSGFQLNKLKGGENVLQDAAKEEAFVYDEEDNLVQDGVAFLSIWGSNCYKTDPSKHKCCEDRGENLESVKKACY